MQMPVAAKRINSVDILRGIVLVIMALDHVRDYFSGFKFEPTDLQHANTVMFFTRWITHFCAPVFIFLSGTSAFLSMGAGRTVKQEAWRLLTRGLWLIVLEHTIVRFGWMFDMDYNALFLQVIWAIGISMIVLSALIFLPRAVILFIGLAMIFLHNLLDGVQGGFLWQLLHVQNMYTYAPGKTVFIIYPLIPWVGVMAVGYCFGALFWFEANKRNKWLYAIGFSAIALFIILRFANIYGDPALWQTQPTAWRTVLSFINCTKYPPSLLYLLMTLGPAIAAMPLLERLTGTVGNIFKVYGRVPLFYYILHIYLIHGIALASSYLFSNGAPVKVFEHPGYDLPVVYGVWLAAVFILYFPCRWFMHKKLSHRKWWLSYL
ncbi:MAG: hypothetical protein K0Q79_1635 [Flavipsychrobacter sp.]|jgi:uncharacterized membrane protein|nr:hypothetical protein [Flavipsychrobacter sp.]